MYYYEVSLWGRRKFYFKRNTPLLNFNHLHNYLSDEDFEAITGFKEISFSEYFLAINKKNCKRFYI